MDNRLDIMNPMISTVSKSIEGKTVLIYGSNSTGKTKQSTKAKKPFYLAFERGINAIAGIPFAPILSWADFVNVRKQLTKPDTLSEVKKRYETIICDTVDAMALMCQEYICNRFGVNSIGDAKEGYGAWAEYEQAFWKEINTLTNCGYTVVFIAHDTEKELTNPDGTKYSKIVPKGDKRSIDPITNLVDIVCFLAVNGLNEDGTEKLSSAYFVNTPQFLARSRFDYMTTYLPEFTWANLESAIKEAVEKEEKASGLTAVDYKTQNKAYAPDETSFEDLKKQIGDYAVKLNSLNRSDEYVAIVDEYYGVGKKVSEATPKQKQVLELILSSLKEKNLE